MVADVDIRFKDGQTMHLHHKVTESEEDSNRLMHKPMSNMYLNENNFVGIYNIY